MSEPEHTGDSPAGDWSDHVPEILTRPEAVAACMDDAKLRRAVVRLADHTIRMARMLRGHPWASEAVSERAALQIERLLSRWRSVYVRAVINQLGATLSHVRKHALEITQGREPDRWPPGARRPGHGVGLRRPSQRITDGGQHG